MKHMHIPLPVLYPTDDEAHDAAMLFFDDAQPWPYRDDDDDDYSTAPSTAPTAEDKTHD
jgi:hypothetical protein